MEIDMQRIVPYDHIPEGGCHIVTIKNEEIAFFKINGEIYAITNECPHKKAPLGEGQIIDHSIFCPKHNWEFDLTTGECLDHPGYCAKKFDVVIKDNYIYLKT